MRFPEILSLEQPDFVAPSQEAIRARYPVLRQEQTQELLLGTAGVAGARPRIAWRFSGQDGRWRVSLASRFLALETTSYVSRSDFLGRLQAVAEALAEHLQPGQLDRLGVRYIDRITGGAVDEIARLVRPEVRGITGTAAATHAAHSISESLFDLPGARLLARWGSLPPVPPSIRPRSNPRTRRAGSSTSTCSARLRCRSSWSAWWRRRGDSPSASTPSSGGQ